MDDFVTIITFAYPTELAVPRSRLESEGIECQVLDELTTQVYPFYSNAIGGVKLQVKGTDLDRAVEILKAGGYIKEEVLKPSKSLGGFEAFTKRIPFLNKLRVEFRLMVVVVACTLFLTGVFYYTTLPPTYERLTEHTWCVDKVIYKGVEYATNTIPMQREGGMKSCEESIEMMTNKTIILPGFNCQPVYGKWAFNGSTLRISEVDTFAFVFNGIYEVDFSYRELVLNSGQTTFHCHQDYDRY